MLATKTPFNAIERATGFGLKNVVSAKMENRKFETHSWTLLLTSYSDCVQENNTLCHCSSPNAFTIHILNAILLGV